MTIDTTEQWKALLGSMDEIVALLAIETLSKEDQLTMIGKFSHIVFKRLLLRIPEEYSEALRAIIEGDDADGSMEAIIGLLARAFPDLNAVVREEMAGVAKLFRQASKSR